MPCQKLTPRAIPWSLCVFQRNAFSCPWQNIGWWLQQQRLWIRSYNKKPKADIFRDRAAAQWCHPGFSFFLLIHPQQLGFSYLELTSHNHQKTVSALNITALYNHVQGRNTGQPLCQLSLSKSRFPPRGPSLPSPAHFPFRLVVRAVVPLLNGIQWEGSTIELSGLASTEHCSCPGAVVGGCRPWLYWIVNKIRAL